MTIKDIAEMAQVSKGTVSRVMNGAPGVGPDTRQRILKLIESVDFQPDASARGLAVRRTNTLGFIIPHTGRYTLTGSFWPTFLMTLTEESAARGINVLLSTPRSEMDVDSAFRSILRGKRIDGAVIGAENFGGKQLTELLRKNLPFVMVGKTPLLSSHFVDVDNALGARMAAEHLAGLGHRRMALVAGPEGLPHVRDRVKGFADALAERGLPAPIVVHVPYDADASVGRVGELLAAHPDLTAVFIAAGDLVIGALRACAQAGRSVPGDLSVVSFDDHPFFPYLAPPVTAVCQPVEELARAAARMLFPLMDGREPERKEAILPPLLAERGSCAPPGVPQASTPRRGDPWFKEESV